MEPAAAANIQHLCYDFDDNGFSAVARLQLHIRPGPVLIIFDEADCWSYRRNTICRGGGGGNDYFHQQSPSQQTQILICKLEGAIAQLQDQFTKLRHVVSDLPLVMTLPLPNITARQLKEALCSSPLLLQADGDPRPATGRQCVWGADVYTLEVSLSVRVPPWLEVQTLQEALQ
ncbi:hypothetical protein ACOMHN_027325 [Nucella lapillus]